MLLKLKELRSRTLRCDPFRKIAGNTAGRWLASRVPGIVFLVELIADGGRRQRGVAATPGGADARGNFGTLHHTKICQGIRPM